MCGQDGTLGPGGHRCARSRRRQAVPVADEDGRGDKRYDTRPENDPHSPTDQSPLTEVNAPQVAEDDDEGHVQAPAGEVVLAHLGSAHAIEEKLSVPHGAAEDSEAVVAEKR